MGEEGREIQKQDSPEIVEGEFRETSAPAVALGGIPEAPLHSLSSLVTIALDGVWSIPELVAAASVVGLPAVPVLAVACGLTCMAAVILIQRYVARDDWGAAFAKGFAMGVVAGVPFPFTGTAAGSVLLIWAGAHAFFGRRQLPPG